MSTIPTPNPTHASATNTTVEMRRTISPCHLTSADNPGAVISHPLLKGINYDEWACGMKTVLTSRKKFGNRSAAGLAIVPSKKPNFLREVNTVFNCLCNRFGHVAENCYAVIGYPEWWEDRPQNRTIQGRGRGDSSSSGGSTSGKGRGSMTYANRVYVPNVDEEGHEQANHVITDHDRDGVSGITDQ
ncbi:PREDICTED: uncharacterized protein LOC109128099 [Camelina sativa]|uniref:Uncharacterized protein LOC109128099 n=1 Tax=Camelina sativa TaxID=90675 RepID=A0ABM1QRN8_CAMSA|nr:PREDICTED: uncharacterized protein LOC109128099 [Camelina sativa]